MSDSLLPKTAPSEEVAALREALETARRAAERHAVELQELEARLALGKQQLAQELHDTVGQSLTAIYLNAKYLERQLEQDGSAAAGDIAALGETIHGAVQELHGVMHRLRAS